MKHSFQRDSSMEPIRTTQGPVRGYLHDGLCVFKGIPYAQARRFHAPEPVAPSAEVFDATSFGYVCPLLTNDRPRGELYVPHRFWPMDEDCLNLNIWTPACDDGARPVLVWLHGGGFEAGSAIEHIAYEGAAMARCGDAVVVTVNHRLNILGYFDLSDFGEEYANSGNAGGDDIIAALAWVRDNIAAFGGDPARVTVFGQSGGGAKVTTLLQSPASDGLYSRGMVMSGVIGPVLADADGSGKDLAEALLKELGLSDVKQLETVDYRPLAAAYRKVKPALQAAGKYTGCRPHPNAFYLGDPCVRGFRPETAGIPLLVGSVFGEFSSFVPPQPGLDAMDDAAQEALVASFFGPEATAELLPLFHAAYPERRAADLLRLDSIFRLPEITYIQKRSRLNGCTWSYLFNMDQPIDGGNTPWHCCDIPYFFHNIDLVEYPHGPQPDPGLSAAVQEQAFASLMAFARTGDPNNAFIPRWDASTEDAEHILVIDGKTRVLDNYDHALVEAHARRSAERMKFSFQNVQH